jgi:hypothetical protein
MSSCLWLQFRVLLCWQTWASFGYRAGSMAMWQGNRSIPGGYPPPGVFQHPLYAVHCLYVIIVHTSSLFGPLFVVICPSSSFVRCCMLLVFICVLLLFVCHHLYIIICCSLFFVCCCTSFIHHHILFIFIHTSLFICCHTPFIFICHHTSFVILHPLYIVPVAMYLEI